MSRLEDLAQEVMGGVKTVKAGVSVPDALAFVVLCLRGVALLYECFQLYPERAVAAARNPGRMQRFWVHRKIRTILAALDDPIDYQEVYKGVLKLGEKISVDEVREAVAEIRAAR